MSIDIRLIADDLAADIGAIDASHYRKDADRLYLSGFEIALVVATGVITSFAIGVFKGIKGKAEKYGIQIGEKLVDSAVAKLGALRHELKTIDAQNSGQIVPQVQKIQDEVASIVDGTEFRKLAPIQENEIARVEVEEVTLYLREVGYPEDTIDTQAQYLTLRVRTQVTEYVRK